MEKEMNHQPKVSVIMPSLNVAAYIRECLESVVNQTLRDIEILCVDAGSTDGTLEILQEYAAKDDRIRLLHSEKKSYGYQMNIGMDAATGEYMGIVETDDYILPEMYEELYAVAKENNVDICKSDYYKFSGHGEGFKKQQVKSTPYNELYKKALVPKEEPRVTAFCLIQAGIYKIELIRRNSIRFNETPGASYQDNGFCFQVSCCAEAVFFYDKPFYMYRQDNENSSINNKEKVFCICEEYDFIYQFIQSRPDLYKYFISKCCRNMFHSYISALNRIDIQYKLDFILRFSEDLNHLSRLGEFFPNEFEEENRIIAYWIMNRPYTFYRDMMKTIIEQEDLLSNRPNVIVSLTSWPARIQTVYLTIKSILNQTIVPDKIILFLSREEFPDEVLPAELCAISDSRFEIVFVDDNLKPHKKYYYVMKLYPDSIIITIDDDAEYDSNLVKKLLTGYIMYPNTVLCTRGHFIKMENAILYSPYSAWQENDKIYNAPSLLLLPTGLGGVLYPPHCLPEAAFDVEKIKLTSLVNDDLWLKYNELKVEIPCVLLSDTSWGENIAGTENCALWNGNRQCKNDEAWGKIIDNDNGLTYSGKIISCLLYEEQSLKRNTPFGAKNNSDELADYYKDALCKTQNSFSYKTGQFVTFIPRKIKGALDCCKEHGLRYTIDCIFHHK